MFIIKILALISALYFGTLLIWATYLLGKGQVRKFSHGHFQAQVIVFSLSLAYLVYPYLR